MEEEYSKREIDNFMKEIHEKLDLILNQTTKTNGRVNKLEKWQSYSQGAVAIITVMIVPIVISIIIDLAR